LKGLTIEAAAGVTTCLLGPSGCGKTTALRLIAGLERPTRGEIVLGDQTVASPASRLFVPSERRRIGMVFQSYALWPHMTVADNVAYPLRMAGAPREERRARVEQALKLVNLGGFDARRVTQLSGGQQQRVALARAIVSRPKVLLLDEPLSALDAKLRERMRIELKELQQRLELTTIFVTHDESEALALGDTVVLMNEGKVVEAASPRAIYGQPVSAFAARFFGTTNFLKGKVGLDAEKRRIVVGGEIELRARIGENIADGADVTASFKAESVVVHRTRPAGANIHPAKVKSVLFLGKVSELQLAVGGLDVVAFINRRDEVAVGEIVYLEIKPDEVVVIA
jgi:iron(III) transport system ATP-binding protein